MDDYISRQAAIDAVRIGMLSTATIYGRSDEGMTARKEIERVIKELPSAQPEPQWISCKDRLPKQGQEVICQCRANIIKVLKLDADGDWYQDAEHCYMGGFAVAWMPLPEPYKEKDNERA